MTLQLVAFGLAVIVIVGGEWILWRLFRSRSRTIEFAHATDASDLRFFTVRRLRMCVLVHTAALLSISAISFFYLW